MNPFRRRNMRCTVHALTFLTFVFGAVTVGSLSLSVATDCWLLTREQVTHTEGNKTSPETYTFWMQTWSGLWRVCVKHESFPETTCLAIYKTDSSGRESHAATSMTIIGDFTDDMREGFFSLTAAMRGSVPLPVTALLLSFIAVVLNVMGSIHADVKTLVCAVFYVLAGLALAVGIILYISAINDEQGYRTNSRKDKDGFQYWYGWSFFCAGISFVSSEIAAVVSVTLYLKRNSKMEDMMRIIPGLEEKVDHDVLREEGIHNPTIVL